MKQKISTLMDGELFEDEAESLLAQFKQDSEANKSWAVYHLIGDVLRQPEYIPADLSATVQVRMQDEPTVLVPRGRRAKLQSRSFALSAAATLAAIGVVAWMSLQVSTEVTPQMAAQQATSQPASQQINPNANEYLMAHQEFSPSTDMSGGASYIRTVAYGTNEK